MIIKHNFEDISFSPWVKLDISNWEGIINKGSTIKYKKNSIIFQEQQNLLSVYIIKSGRIRLTVSNKDGDEKHIMIAEVGCIIGESSCLLNVPSMTAATTIVNTEMYEISKSDFLKYININKELNKLIMSIISIKNNIFIQQISDLSFSSSIERVSKALYDLANLYGVKYGNSYRINIKFTHQDIANLINCSRVTVSKIFSQLLDDKIIERKNGYIIVNDLEQIKELIAMDKILL